MPVYSRVYYKLYYYDETEKYGWTIILTDYYTGHTLSNPAFSWHLLFQAINLNFKSNFCHKGD